MYCPGFAGKDPTRDPELARQFLFHDGDGAVVNWAAATLRLMFATGAAVETAGLAERGRSIPNGGKMRRESGST